MKKYFKKNKLWKIKKALWIIKKAFEHNIDAHYFKEESQNAYYNYNHDDAQLYSQHKEYYYEQKQKCIEKVIQYIKKNSLPIKYWVNENIIYFSFLWKQVGFHTFSKKAKENKIKKYNWNWSWRPNEEIFPINIWDL